MLGLFSESQLFLFSLHYARQNNNILSIYELAVPLHVVFVFLCDYYLHYKS